MKPTYYSTTELAEKIGVSRQVISAIINETWKDKRISEATYERVKHAMEELGYVPDKAATALKKSSRDLIGIIYHGPLHSHILVAIQKLNHYYHENNFAVKIVISQENSLKAAIEDLMGDRVQKIIILLSSMTKKFSGDDLTEAGTQSLLKVIPHIIYNFPFDVHGRELEKKLISGGAQLVGFSRAEVYQTFFKQLLEENKTNVLIDEKLLVLLTTQHAFDKLLSSFTSIETFPNPSFKGIDQNRYLIGEELGKDLLPRIKENRFDFIITDSDMIAQGLAARLIRNGIRIPQKLEILGFDNIEALPYFKTRLSTIEVPVDHMVKKVITLLKEDSSSGKAYRLKAALQLR